MPLPSTGHGLDAEHIALHEALHIAALNWASGEEQDMRRAGLDRWAVDTGETLLRWNVPLDGVHRDIDVHLSLRTTEWDGRGHTAKKLVWQLKVFRTAQLATEIRQSVLAELAGGSMTMSAVEDIVNTIYSAGTAEVVGWTKQTLAEMGLRHAIHARP